MNGRDNNLASQTLQATTEAGQCGLSASSSLARASAAAWPAEIQPAAFDRQAALSQSTAGARWFVWRTKKVARRSIRGARSLICHRFSRSAISATISGPTETFLGRSQKTWQVHLWTLRAQSSSSHPIWRHIRRASRKLPMRPGYPCSARRNRQPDRLHLHTDAQEANKLATG